VVERRLALAHASPALLDLFRKDEITTEQLRALCATDDHALQESVWRNTPSWSRHPGNLRRAVLSDEVDASHDARVAFIGGLDAFTDAGGEVRRDLFSENGGGGFITDAALLERLVTARLEAAAEDVRAEGWAWVEIRPQWDYNEYYRLGHIPTTTIEMSPEAAEKVEALRSEYSALLAESNLLYGDAAEEDDEPEDAGISPDDADDVEGLLSEDGGMGAGFVDMEEEGDDSQLSDESRERLDAIHARMDEIEREIRALQARKCYDPAAVAAAGAIVAREGKTLRIERGLVRTADRAKAAQAIGNASAISGGRETEVSGRKSGALSDSMTRSMLGYRNLAAQSAIAAAPRVAKLLLAVWIIQTTRNRQHNTPIDLRISDTGFGTRTQHPIADEGGDVRRKAFEAIGANLIAPLPKEDSALWDALMEFEDQQLDALIAFAVASALSLHRDHTSFTGKLLDSLGFDMASHFTATTVNYLSRVPKSLIVEALSEAGKITDEPHRAMLLALKKPDLAAKAESMLLDSGWVPAVIRTPKPKSAPATKKPRKAKTSPKRVAKAPAAKKKDPAAPKGESKPSRRRRATAAAAGGDTPPLRLHVDEPASVPAAPSQPKARAVSARSRSAKAARPKGTKASRSKRQPKTPPAPRKAPVTRGSEAGPLRLHVDTPPAPGQQPDRIAA